MSVNAETPAEIKDEDVSYCVKRRGGVLFNFVLSRNENGVKIAGSLCLLNLSFYDNFLLMQ